MCTRMATNVSSELHVKGCEHVLHGNYDEATRIAQHVTSGATESYNQHAPGAPTQDADAMCVHNLCHARVHHTHSTVGSWTFGELRVL